MAEERAVHALFMNCSLYSGALPRVRRSHNYSVYITTRRGVLSSFASRVQQHVWAHSKIINSELQLQFFSRGRKGKYRRQQSLHDHKGARTRASFQEDSRTFHTSPQNLDHSFLNAGGAGRGRGSGHVGSISGESYGVHMPNKGLIR